MSDLLALLEQLCRENEQTEAELRKLQSRSEKERQDIAAVKRSATVLHERNHPDEPLPDALLERPATPPSSESKNGTASLEKVLQILTTALEGAPARFTTKEFFPLVPGLYGEISETAAYEFLRRLVNEGKLWVHEVGKGRRPTTYGKEPPVEPFEVAEIAPVNPASLPRPLPRPAPSRPMPTPMFYGGGEAVPINS